MKKETRRRVAMTTHRTVDRKDDLVPPLNLPHLMFLGRPVKPVALALTVAMLVTSVSAWTNSGLLDGSAIADWISAPAMLACGMLTWAWIRKSQHLAECGLIWAFAVFVFRTMCAITLDINALREGVALSICWAIVAGGAYFLEKADPVAMGWTSSKG